MARIPLVISLVDSSPFLTPGFFVAPKKFQPSPLLSLSSPNIALALLSSASLLVSSTMSTSTSVSIFFLSTLPNLSLPLLFVFVSLLSAFDLFALFGGDMTGLSGSSDSSLTRSSSASISASSLTLASASSLAFASSFSLSFSLKVLNLDVVVPPPMPPQKLLAALAGVSSLTSSFSSSFSRE